MMLLVLACVPNTPPSMVGFTLSPEDPVTGDTLVTEITVQPVDAEGHEISLVYRWYRNEELQEDLAAWVVAGLLTDEGAIAPDFTAKERKSPIPNPSWSSGHVIGFIPAESS